LLHSTEGAHRDVPVRLAVPRTAPSFQLQQLLRRFLDERLNRILIAEPVAARDRVVGVFIQTVVGFCYSGRAALGGNRVAAHGIDLGNYGNAELRIDFGGSDRGAQSGAATSYEKNVVRRSFHDSPLRPQTEWPL